jgi:predicted GNAT superfamily acetyltransferase
VGRIETPTLSPSALTFRPCVSLAEYDDCVRLQHIVWGESIAVPSAMFVVAREIGGQVLGAFDSGRLIGFTMALVGSHGSAQLFLHSHMTAVIEEHRNRGVGRHLKLAQREDALTRAIHLIEWTFDPLDLRNAHFNLIRLGAIVRHLIPNFYGITDSPLHHHMPTDRLLAEWRLDSPRVTSILAGLQRRDNPGAVRIALPANIDHLRRADPPAALAAQSRLREELTAWFNKGYAATGFEPAGDEFHYILEPDS